MRGLMKKILFLLLLVLVITAISCDISIDEIGENNAFITESSVKSNLFGNLFIKKLTRNWKIYIIHHTHVDIGYTHTQDEVLKIQ